MQTNASPSETDKEREILLKQFRAYLHLAITAKQTDQGKKLEAIPGPNTLTYCLELAELTDNTLARELAWPVVAVLDQISHVTNVCEGTLARQDEKSMAMHAKATRILDQLDFALALILRNHIWRIQHRGAVTKNVELLGLLTSLATGDGVEAARLIRRFQKLNPEDPREPDGSVSPESCPDEFAWDALPTGRSLG